MKLIKICLLSLIALPAKNVLASDLTPANTGAAKSSDITGEDSARPARTVVNIKPMAAQPMVAQSVFKTPVSAIPPKAADYSPVYADESFPSLEDAARMTAAASKPRHSRSIKTVKPTEVDASELPTEFNGALPNINTKHGEYKPKIYSRWNFPSVSKALKTSEEIDLRSVEKASAEAWQNPDEFNSEDVAEFAQLVNDKKLDINPAYWGDMHGSCKRTKEQEARNLVRLVQESAARLQRYKAGEVASLEGYGRSNGSGYSSPTADYGMGPKFGDNEVAACQQVIAKAFEITARKDMTSKAEAEADLVEVLPDFNKK
jgi:hypothetical protein